MRGDLSWGREQTHAAPLETPVYRCITDPLFTDSQCALKNRSRRLGGEFAKVSKSARALIRGAALWVIWRRYELPDFHSGLVQEVPCWAETVGESTMAECLRAGGSDRMKVMLQCG